MDTEGSLSIGQCWILSWCSVASFVLCKDGEGSCATFYGGSEKSLFDWTVALQMSPSLVEIKYETEGVFQQLKRQETCYLLHHMAAVGHQSRGWGCWSPDRSVIHMAQVCVYLPKGVALYLAPFFWLGEVLLPAKLWTVRHETPRIFLRCEKFQA